MMKKIQLTTTLFALIIFSNANAGKTKIKFDEVSSKAGINFQHQKAEFDPKVSNVMPWLTAGGAAATVGDFNNDGLEDIYFTTSKADAKNHLYQNLGNFKFKEVANEVGLADVNKKETGTSAFALWFDYNNDQWIDLLLVRFGKLALFENQKGKHFQEVTKKAGLTLYLNSLSAVAFDYDRDGDLDLYIAGYFPEKNLANLTSDTEVLFESWETARNGGPNYFFRNNGDGTFTDLTTEVGLEDTGWTMAIGHGDLDNDGWQDIYNANDFGTDHIYRNMGNGKFQIMSDSSIGTDTKKGMNADFGDYNNDGLLDIYVTNMTEPYLHECNMLWENFGDFNFTDVSKETNSCDTGWGWGAKFLDVDNDGKLDIYVANGFVSEGDKEYMEKLLEFIFMENVNLPDATRWPDMKGYSMGGNEKNYLLHQKYGFFKSIGAQAGVDDLGDARGVAVADFDQDGRMDIIVTNVNGPVKVYQNTSKTKNNWISIKLQSDQNNNYLAIGARVKIKSGNLSQIREIMTASGFEAQSTTVAHFGIKKSKTVNEVVITWPDGSVSQYKNLEANNHYMIKKGNQPLKLGLAVTEKKKINKSKALFQNVTDDSGIVITHKPPIFDKKLEHIMAMLSAGAAGAAIGDYNNDGLLDIFVNNARRGTLNHLYRNEGNLKFTEVAQKAGVAEFNHDNQISAGGLFFDYNGDGYEDLLILRFGTQVLLENTKQGTFVDVSEKSGINKIVSNALAAIAFDFDKDGDVDIYFGNYFPDLNMFQLPHTKILHDSWETSRNGGKNILARNEGNGTFTILTDNPVLADTGWTMAVGHGDYNNDGWQDIYIANDYGADKLLKNVKGEFIDVSREAIGIDTRKGMNVEFGDVDNNGYLDIFVTNVTEEFLYECNMLWMNNQDGSFTDLSRELNLCDAGWAWGGKFFDYDNDGDLDLYVANGFFSGKGDYLDVLLPSMWKTGEDPSEAKEWPPLNGMGMATKERNVLFKNVSGISFKKIQKSAVNIDKDSRGVFTADFDNDGKLDIFVTNNEDSAVIFQNTTTNKNNWIILDLKAVPPNTNAIGARITLSARGRHYIREINVGNGFAGNSSKRVHFGLGKAKTIDYVEILWPNGEKQRLDSLSINQIYTVQQ
jgi:hypothetical protein